MPSPRAAARKDRLKRVIAIVDYGGHLVLLLKDDVTRVGSIEIAILTARTAGHFNHPTKAFPIAERLDRGAPSSWSQGLGSAIRSAVLAKGAGYPSCRHR